MAKNKTVYVFTTEEGTTETFTTVGALNKFAGIRATKATIEEGKFPNVTIQDDSTEEEQASLTLEEVADASEGKVEIIAVGDAPKATVVEEPTLDLTDEEHAEVVKQAEEEGSLPEVLTNEEADTVADLVDAGTEPTEDSQVEDTVDPEDAEQLEYPEVGHFESEKDMKKYVKGLTNEQLAEWCELEGAEYKSNDHVSINRMRMAMAIKGLHFPETAKPKGTTKKKSKYGDYTLEDLAEMAIENDVEVRDSKGDPRIERMYLIMALKAAGLLSQ